MKITNDFILMDYSEQFEYAWNYLVVRNVSRELVAPYININDIGYKAQLNRLPENGNKNIEHVVTGVYLLFIANPDILNQDSIINFFKTFATRFPEVVYFTSLNTYEDILTAFQDWKKNPLKSVITNKEGYLAKGREILEYATKLRPMYRNTDSYKYRQLTMSGTIFKKINQIIADVEA